ncbi:hypothetical protein J7K24_01085 [bacterium]|nr:hypothetical protein [bacterium]
MKDFLKFVLLFIIGLIFLFFVGFYFTTQEINQMQSSFSAIDFLKSQSSDLNQTNTIKAEYKEFISPDEKLKLKYQDDWQEIKDKTEIDKLFPLDIKEKYGLQVLFLARRINEKGPAQLVISKGETKQASSSKELINNLIEDIYKQIENAQTEILNVQTEHKKGEFEVKYIYGNHIFRSKEIVRLTSNEDFYIIDFFAPDNLWKNFEEEIEKLIESIQLSD